MLRVTCFSCLISWLQTIDKQPLLDSGILCCLIYILNSLLSPDESSQKSSPVGQEVSTSEKSKDWGPMLSRRLEVIPVSWFLYKEDFLCIIF